MLPRKSAIKVGPYFIFPSNLTSASALPGEMQKHKIASDHANAVLLHCQTSTSHWFNLFSLVTCSSCMPYDSLNLVVSGVKLWTVIRPWVRRKEVESFALQQLDCVELSCWKICKIVVNDVLIASNICCDSKISQQYCPLTFAPCLMKNNSYFDTVTNTMTDLVNIKREVTYSRMLCSLPRSCLVHAVDCFDSEGWLSCDHDILNVFHVLSVK